MSFNPTKGDAGADTYEISGDNNIENVAGHKDRAAILVKEAEAAGQRIVVTPEENKRILRKIDMRLLPILLVVYGLQSLDKSSLSYASVFGIVTDTKLHGLQYSWLGSIVYVAQLVFQPLIAYLLVKLPIGKFASVMVLTWAIILCGMCGARDFKGLIGTRFLLGAAESAIAPTFIAITNMWYRRSEQTLRNSFWYASLGGVNILGSILAYGLGHIKSSHLYTYQIIFLFCGLLTLVVSVFVFIFLPDSPIRARFLKQDEKLIAVERLRMNQMGVSSGIWDWGHVREVLLDLKTWMFFSLLLTISIPSGGISTFGPLIIKAFGFDKYTTILFNIPFGAVQMVSTIGGAWLATRYKVKSVVLIGITIPPIIGIAMLMAIPYTKANRGKLLAGYYLISFYPGISPLIYSWSQQNTGGDTKKKCLVGLMFIGSNAGNIIGPLLFKTNEAPRYTRGLIVNLALFVTLTVLTIATATYLRFLNSKHANMRVAVGKPAKIVDLSMKTNKELQDEGLNGNEVEGEQTGNKGFDDITDLKNEDFVYVY